MNKKEKDEVMEMFAEFYAEQEKLYRNTKYYIIATSVILCVLMVVMVIVNITK